MSDFDVIVIGTGVTGQTAAEELAAGGKRVAIVDRREYGGTCILRGCEPKKVLFTAAEVVERAAAQRGRGPTGDLRLDWPSLIAFKRGFTEPAPAGVEKALSDAGVATLHGEARFADEDTLLIDGVRHRAEHIVVASGALPMRLGIAGEDLMLTSEGFMATEHLGERIVFIGGGYISFEFAHMAAAAGAHVTICHRGSHVLRGFDQELAAMLVEGYRKAGIGVRTEAPVRAVEKDGEALTVVLEDGTRLPCDMVVHGAGRVPDIEALDLETGGVGFGPRGIAVDEHLRSVTNARVWAAGDAADRGLPLTPVGITQARVVVRGILGDGDAVYDPAVTPSVVFSDPPLAAIGLTRRPGGRAGHRRRGTADRHDHVGRLAACRRPRVGRQGARRAGDRAHRGRPSARPPRRGGHQRLRRRDRRRPHRRRPEGDAVGVPDGGLGYRQPPLRRRRPCSRRPQRRRRRRRPPPG